MPTSDSEFTGSGLAFVLGAFRSGTTLLRKVLDSHTQVHSPAETWFLLPLLNMWDGHGQAPHFNPTQAAAAMRGLMSQEDFVACARAFAGVLYRRSLRPGSSWFVDKTPLYLQIAPALPVLFPQARFLVLTRDPRAICWSRHTWRHLKSASPDSHFGGVAQDVQRLASFLRGNADRSLLVSYERLCEAPQDEARRLCEFFGLAYEPNMIEYGASSHHEGYGDETTRLHPRPHADSLARWEGGLSAEQQTTLLDRCGESALAILGMGALKATSPVLRRSA